MTQNIFTAKFEQFNGVEQFPHITPASGLVHILTMMEFEMEVEHIALVPIRNAIICGEIRTEQETHFSMGDVILHEEEPKLSLELITDQKFVVDMWEKESLPSKKGFILAIGIQDRDFFIVSRFV